MRIVCNEQRTAEWLSLKVGKITASRIAAAMRKMERGYGDKKAGDWHGDHDKLVRRLVRELMTGVPAWSKVTAEMDYGVTWESDARRAYAEYIGEEVTETGLILHPTKDYIGCSPDGLVLSLRKGVELKVPLLETHENYLIEDKVPEEYKPQMQMCMLCTGLPEWDFVSWCPKDEDDPERFAWPDELRLFVKTLQFDPEYRLQKNGPTIEEAATATIEEAVALVQKLSESRHLRLQKPAVEMPKEMLLSAGEEPIF